MRDLLSRIEASRRELLMRGFLSDRVRNVGQLPEIGVAKEKLL